MDLHKHEMVIMVKKARDKIQRRRKATGCAGVLMAALLVAVRARMLELFPHDRDIQFLHKTMEVDTLFVMKVSLSSLQRNNAIPCNECHLLELLSQTSSTKEKRLHSELVCAEER